MSADRSGAPELLELIRHEIRAGGPISFARFMELAQHHPVHGYYAAGASRLGVSGNYFTASDVGNAFGRCIARQMAELDDRLGRPDPFAIVEFGGGRGLLARDVLDAAPADLSRRIRYLVVDASPGMRRSAASVAPEARAIPPGAPAVEMVGCVLAVELFDALPVHRIRRTAGRLREVYVDLDEQSRLVEREGDPGGDVRGLAERYGAAPYDGDEAEVCPAIPGQLASMHRWLERGFVLIVDYGYTAAELYGPTHNRGTLLAYHRHAVNEDYLLRAGRQDLTAHVNFTALDDGARELGLDVVGHTTQDRFLIANGILTPFDDTDPERWNDPARVRERLRVSQLIHAEGMGRMFRVAMFSKGMTPLPRLAGLQDPFAR